MDILVLIVFVYNYLCREKNILKELSILAVADNISHKFYQNISIAEEKTRIVNFEQAFNVMRDCEAHIIIIDGGIKSNDAGLSLLKMIKEQNPSIPVIFITNNSSEELAINAFRLGAREYLPKPVDILELSEIIKNILEKKRAVKEKRLPVTKPYSRFAYPSNKASNLPLKLQQIISYIQENLSENISLNDLAKKANYSKYHFCRYFKKYMSITPMEYILFLRIENVKKLLAEEELSITEIGLEVGFTHHSTLTRNFRHFTGFSPNEYRKWLKNHKTIKMT